MTEPPAEAGGFWLFIGVIKHEKAHLNGELILFNKFYPVSEMFC